MFNFLHDFPVLRKATHVVLAIDLLAIEHDVKDSAAALDEFAMHLIFAETVLQFGHQTGGLRQVVSLIAVRDLNLHTRLLSNERIVAIDPVGRNAGDRHESTR